MVLDLDPATWYNVRITAHNSAGFTVAEYEFATLTVTGGIYPHPIQAHLFFFVSLLYLKEKQILKKLLKHAEYNFKCIGTTFFTAKKMCIKMRIE